MHAMILSAGLGTRLRPLTDRVPKPLVPVGLETALGRWLRLLAAQGVREVVVNLHHLGDAIRRAIDRAPPAGLRVTWSEEPELLGTGGGVRRALPHLGDAPFLVVNGDVVADLDLAALESAHVRSGAAATMLVRRDPEARRLGAVEVDAQGFVRRLLGAPESVDAPLEEHMFTGIQIVDPRATDRLPETGCIVRSLYRSLVDEGRLGAVRHDGAWFDVGSIAGYLDANAWIAGEGVVAHPSAEIDPTARFGPSVVVGAGARIAAGAIVRRAVVWPGTVVEGVLEDAVATPFAIRKRPASAPGSR